MNPIEQINTAVDTFDKYGLPGLVILACFISLWALIRFMKTMNDEHLELYEKQGELHAAERKEWILQAKDTAEIMRVLSVQFESRKCYAAQNRN